MPSFHCNTDQQQTEQNKSPVADHAISLNHVIDWDHAKVIDRESNRMDQWWIKKEQKKSMNWDGGSYQLPRIYDKVFAVATSSILKKATVVARISLNQYLQSLQFDEFI